MILKNNMKIFITGINKMAILYFIKVLNKFLKLTYKETKTFVSLPKNEKRLTLLRSPHKFKKSREQYSLIKYKYLIELEKFTPYTYLIINSIKPQFINLDFKWNIKNSEK